VLCRSGGIICLGTCLAKVPIQEMIDVYEHRATDIWTPKRSLANMVAGKLAGTQYDHGPLEAILRKNSIDRAFRPRAGTFGGGDGMLRQLRMDDDLSAGPKVFVVSALEKQGITEGAPFDMHLFRSYRLRHIGIRTGIQNWLRFTTTILRSDPLNDVTEHRYTPQHERSAGSSNCEVWQAGRATSAAPVYFDPISIHGQIFVDGGVCENNPVGVARKEAEDIWPGRPVGLILSLGCGLASKDKGEYSGAAGAIGSAKKAAAQLINPQPRHIEALQDLSIPYDKGNPHDPRYTFGGDCGQARAAVFRGARYVRLNPPLLHSVKMDTSDPVELAGMRAAAEAFLAREDTTAELRQVRERLGYPSWATGAVISVGRGGYVSGAGWLCQWGGVVMSVGRGGYVRCERGWATRPGRPGTAASGASLATPRLHPQESRSYTLCQWRRQHQRRRRLPPQDKRS
jgi:hypothetical protein